MPWKPVAMDLRYGLWVDGSKLLDPPIEIAETSGQRHLYEGGLRGEGVLYLTQLDEEDGSPVAQMAFRERGRISR